MTILLYKDGRLVIDDGNPIEGNSLEGLVACVSDPQIGDILKFDGNQWVAGTAASGLPAVSGTDNGKVLTVVEGDWAPAAASGGGGLIIETTYSEDVYTMNKTTREIMAALAAGKTVILHVPDEEFYVDQYGAVVHIKGSASRDAYTVYAYFQGNVEQFSSASLDDYPSLYVANE